LAVKAATTPLHYASGATPDHRGYVGQLIRARGPRLGG